MGWHFRAGERLALVSIPSGRDVRAGNSQVLKRIGIDLLGKIGYGLPSPGMDRGGYACLEKDGNDQVLEKIGID